MMPKQANSKRDVIALILIPLVLMGLLAAVVYLPRLLATPAYDFIYTTCESYDCYDPVGVQGGLSVESNFSMGLNFSVGSDTPVTFHYYDVSEQAHRTLTPAEARQYALDNSSRSPDGYTLERQSSSSGFLLWSDSEPDHWILKKGLYKEPVYFGDTAYHNDITFVGWVK